MKKILMKRNLMKQILMERFRYNISSVINNLVATIF